jgi:hypothetical protein
MRDERVGCKGSLHPIDAKRVMPLTPVPCGGGLGDVPVPQWGFGGKAPKKDSAKTNHSQTTTANSQTDCHPYG